MLWLCFDVLMATKTYNAEGSCCWDRLLKVYIKKYKKCNKNMTGVRLNGDEWKGKSLYSWFCGMICGRNCER